MINDIFTPVSVSSAIAGCERYCMFANRKIFNNNERFELKGAV